MKNQIIKLISNNYLQKTVTGCVLLTECRKQNPVQLFLAENSLVHVLWGIRWLYNHWRGWKNSCQKWTLVRLLALSTFDPVIRNYYCHPWIRKMLQLWLPPLLKSQPPPLASWYLTISMGVQHAACNMPAFHWCWGGTSSPVLCCFPSVFQIWERYVS